ncbi:MAG: ydeS [Pseudonocardia sp.]|jgi:AcrR family transcriptional regulator|nr:ydeS [Pseudonocardia sp.]
MPESGRSPDRGRSAQSHAAIMDAAAAIFAESGYHQLTMEGVAARAGVGKTTVYRWWPTKLDLLIDVIGTALEAGNRQPMELAGDSAVVIRELIRRMSEIIASPVGRMITTVAGELVGDPEARQRFEAVIGPFRAVATSVIYYVIGRGDLPHDLDAQVLLDLIIGTLFGRAVTGRPPNADFVTQVVDLVMEGRLPRVRP